LSENERDLAEAILIAGNQIASGLFAVAQALKSQIPPQATKGVLTYKLRGGTMGVAEPLAIVGQVYDPTWVESSATNPSIQPKGPVVYASDNTAVATVDPNTGIATMVGPGTANVSALDQGNGLTDTVTFTVSAAPPPVATVGTLSYALAAAQVRKGK
jgi:hypothetical protein